MSPVRRAFRFTAFSAVATALVLALTRVAAAHPELDVWLDQLESVAARVSIDAEADRRCLTIELPDRSFVLDLVPSRLARRLRERPGLSGGAAAASEGDYLHGTVRGAPDSSAAVSIEGSRVHAMVRDGMDVLMVEAGYDGSGHAWSGVDPFSGPSMLAPSSADRGATPSYVLEVALVADFEFFQKHGGSTTAKMLSVLNLVDAIYRDQIDLTLDVVVSTVFDSSGDPFSDFQSANLFNNYRDATTQFGDWRNMQSGPVKTAGIAHLFSDRNLNVPPGAKINAGFGFIDTLCTANRGISISTAPAIGDSLHATVVAHEFGHNFGARHDGEAPCTTIPVGDFIMEAAAAGVTFSPCTLSVIVAGRNDAACIDEAVATTTTTLPPPLCGDHNGDAGVLATDALAVLKTAVGLEVCALCVCDADASGVVLATDAQMVLRFAVGLLAELGCPAC